jgi:two-component system OmpR family response regulator
MARLQTVMIIDDSPACTEFMALALEAEGGAAIISETRPQRALERIRTERPSLILLDVKMPELDGFEVLSSLRADGLPTPVIMVSGSSRQADIDRAYALGCNGYLVKPNSIDDYRHIAGAVLTYWRGNEVPAG